VKILNLFIMQKYIFTQPYSIRKGNYSIGSGGATGGTIFKSFNKGDIIEGVKKSVWYDRAWTAIEVNGLLPA
jgi:hypothetical protein